MAESWGITGLMVLSMLVFSPLFIGLRLILDEGLSFLLYYIFVFSIPLLLFKAKRKKRNGDASFNFAIGNLRIAALVILCTTSMLFAITTPLVSLIPMPEVFREIFEGMHYSGIFSHVAIVVAAPLLEELIMRGIVLDGLLKRYDPVKSILLSSFLFGILHLNPWQFISAFVIGIFAGWVYWKTKRISLAILIHMTNNLMALLISLTNKDTPTLDGSFLDTYGGSFYAVMIIVVGLITFAGCIYLLKKEFLKEKVKVPDEVNITPAAKFWE
ncbi:CPBP family intramembrane glutamic endopeptidase [Echinicola strongylocentroti]|nr:type II CAAX endopeptidase family protein [Echinicola strongylocentroti]